ncbi:putative hydrolase YuaR [Cyphellophora attinorum]|uniref:Putative hydrolase YuaR n=1 Tax=Cyphellophora attinorum TaxID=1664694 RepID=A0A0N1H6U5_9EURO|nr:putative hydrolase YuaR [Phialophora attinorum]KPI41897.1 putative hydrolase YuaR [Phialophora attinorum]
MQSTLLVLSTICSLASAAIQWGNCSNAIIPLASPKLQCATLSVPLNWSDTSSTNITIGLTRVEAGDTSKRIGSLIFNPGGPGEPASTVLAGQALGFPLFSTNISDVFDLVGFDPRGVGPFSTPVICDPEVFNTRINYYPNSTSQYNDLVTANKAIWQNCHNLTGDLLYNVDTLSVAKDLEALRIALDDGPLNFLGISYGTVIAQTYARLHPSSFRTIAMDAVVDHNISATAQFFDEAQTYEASLHRFASWCSSTNSTFCPLKGKDVISIFNATVANATRSPLPVPGCVNTDPSITGGCFANITAAELISTAQTLLTFKDPNAPVTLGWPALAGALALAAQGNGTAMAQAFAAANLATSNISSLFAGTVIPCLDDYTGINSFADIQYRLRLGEYVAPLTKGISEKWRQQVRCIGFPIPPTYPQTDMSVNNTGKGDKEMLLATSEWDPNVPWLWAEQARSAIGNATLVLREGDGHTSFYLGGKTTRVIEEYFVSGVAPEQGLVVPS